MRKVIQFLIVSLVPIAVVMAYSTVYSFVSDYAGRYYDMFPLIVTVLLGYILIGVTAFFICKTGLKQADAARIPYEYIVGILIALIPTICAFLPVYIPPFITLAFGIGMPISGLFIGVYICLFIFLLSRRAKLLKQLKAEKNIDPQM